VIWGAYVHIPWCRIRCPYCAFAVEDLRSAQATTTPAAYTAAVRAQWEAHGEAFVGPPSSVAFGGGTPSLHPPEELSRVLAALDPAPGAEVTLEANPEDLDRDRIAALQDLGVTRLSLGVQTFQRHTARVLARVHTVEAAQAALRGVAHAGFESWSVDLIFGIPGQTREDLERDLDVVLSEDVPHLSLYGLSEEEGTPYARGVTLGRFQPPGSDTWRALYDLARHRLAEAGLDQYEVSNFARPGHRSRHNEHYWRVRPWAGLGLAAHGRLPDGTGTVSRSELPRYLAQPHTWESCTPPSARALAEELLLCCLRHVDGLDLARLSALGWSLERRAVEALVGRGWARLGPGTLCLTPAGLPVADTATASLALALQTTPEEPAGKSPP